MKNLEKRFVLALMVLVSLALGSPAAAQEQDETYPGYGLTAAAELGFLAALSHKFQNGADGTYFDYVEDGGQDTLYFIGRASLELELKRRHTVIFLYQPLSIETDEVLASDLVVDDETFKAGTPMRFRYDFPFYRVSYLYDFFDAPGLEVALGGSLQIRNATINFTSVDGTQQRTNRSVGPVPALKFRARYTFGNGLFVGTEMDGMYAPVSYLNGDDNEVVGAILDASLRAGVKVTDRIDAFLNLRYLGGGAEGYSDNDKYGDGYNKNWLHFMTTTAGFTVRLR